jgi:hypothetical protein
MKMSGHPTNDRRKSGRPRSSRLMIDLMSDLMRDRSSASCRYCLNLCRLV